MLPGAKLAASISPLDLWILLQKIQIHMISMRKYIYYKQYKYKHK